MNDAITGKDEELVLLKLENKKLKKKNKELKKKNKEFIASIQELTLQRDRFLYD